MRKFVAILSAVVLGLVSVACSDSHSDEPAVPPADTTGVDSTAMRSRTILVYMVAGNNLGSMGLDDADINEMKRGMLALADTAQRRLIVYHETSSGSCFLKEVKASGEIDTLGTYSRALTSVSIERMSEVIGDVKEIAAADSYGLVLWSHGTGWLEDAGCYNDPDYVKPLSFGFDHNRRKMKIPALAQALMGTRFDFIYFDCCLMGTVEVAYELRNVCSEISACCTELPIEGMPYHTNIPLLFAGKLVDATRQTLEYYMKAGNFSESGCALGVYNTSALEELADVSRDILSTGVLPPTGASALPYFRPSMVPAGSYDMAQYVRTLPLPAALLSRFNSAYADVVEWSGTTPVSFGISMNGFTGLGWNIFSGPRDASLGYGYRNLEWWTDVASHSPLVQ